VLDSLIKVSVNYLVKQNVINDDDRDVYEYGFHSLYSNVFIFFVIGIGAILLNQFAQTIIYHAIFIVMRSVAGGYHARSQWCCFILSVLVWILSLFAIAYINFPIVSIALSLISMIIVWAKAPAVHENNPLSDSKRSKMKILSRILSLLFLFAVMVLALWNNKNLWVANSIACGLFTHSTLMIYYLNRKKNEVDT